MNGFSKMISQVPVRNLVIFWGHFVDQLEGFRAIGRYEHPEDSSAWQMNLGALQVALRLKYRLYVYMSGSAEFLLANYFGKVA